jgi:hypothetical protein
MHLFSGASSTNFERQQLLLQEKRTCQVGRHRVSRGQVFAAVGGGAAGIAARVEPHLSLVRDNLQLRD